MKSRGGAPRTCRDADGDRDGDDLVPLRVIIRDVQPLGTTRVTIGGRRLKTTRRTNFRLVVDVAKLRLGAAPPEGGRGARERREVEPLDHDQPLPAGEWRA